MWMNDIRHSRSYLFDFLQSSYNLIQTRLFITSQGTKLFFLVWSSTQRMLHGLSAKYDINLSYHSRQYCSWKWDIKIVLFIKEGQDLILTEENRKYPTLVLIVFLNLKHFRYPYPQKGVFKGFQTKTFTTYFFRVLLDLLKYLYKNIL